MNVGPADRHRGRRQHRLLRRRHAGRRRPPRVALLARPRVIAEIEAHGLRPDELRRFRPALAANQLALSENPSMFCRCRRRAGHGEERRHRRAWPRSSPGTRLPDAVIVSLQNGVGNAALLREQLPGRRVLGGMVPFNVIALGEGRFHRATSGDIVIEQDDGATAEKPFGARPEDARHRQHRRACNGASCCSI